MVEIKKIESSLPIIYKTGKVLIGKNNVIWALKNEPQHIKVILISKNPPPNLEEEIFNIIKRNSVRIPVIKLSKTNLEIGDLCGRPHSISVLAIYEFGSASISEEDISIYR